MVNYGNEVEAKEKEEGPCGLSEDSGGYKCSDSGIESDAPTSVGQIHDIFAEFEETFGIARRKQKTVVAKLRDCPDRDVTAGSIPRPVSQAEPRSAANDGAANMEQLAEAVGRDPGPNNLSEEEIQNGSTFQSKQESDGRETKTEDVRPQCISTLAAHVASSLGKASVKEPSNNIRKWGRVEL